MLSSISPSATAPLSRAKPPPPSDSGLVRSSASAASGAGKSKAPAPGEASSRASDSLSSLAGSSSEAPKGTSTDPAKQELSRAEQIELRKLKQRDQEVRAHEQAHIAAGGSYVQGGARFSYTLGPDGNRYAVGGEVSIDTSSVPQDPEATLRKAEAVRKAALAPAQPSARDRAVAAEAARMAAEAKQEVLEASLEAPQESPGDVYQPQAASISSQDSESVVNMMQQVEKMQQSRTMHPSAAARYQTHTLAAVLYSSNPSRIDLLI